MTKSAPQSHMLSEQYDHWFREQVEIGRVSADKGALSSNEDIEAEFAARRKASLKQAKQD